VFSVEVDSRVEDQPPELLYDIARELLVNASKHSNGRSVWCRVDLSESGTRVVVSDDGVGFDPGMLAQRARDGHVGLASIDARVAALGGSVSFRSTPGGGAVVKVVIPCAGEQCA
jgi:two-component system NarL family sensor kinase